jgi:hypothetical protein
MVRLVQGPGKLILQPTASMRRKIAGATLACAARNASFTVNFCISDLAY